MPRFEGKSQTGSFQEALDDGAKKALKSITHTDPMISFTVKEISGRKGGFANFNELSVVIEADLH